jgi:hypothetical protein
MQILPLQTTIATVWIAHDRLHIELDDGREMSVPLVWFPRLMRVASWEERAHWELSPDRTGIHWPDVDEDISVRVLMGHPS